MKNAIFALVLAATIPVAAFAAMDGHGRHDRGARLDRMAEKLELNDNQKERMKALFEEHNAERKALREQMREQMDEILTVKQRAQLDGMQSKRREHRNARRGRHYKRGFHDDNSADDDSADDDSSDHKSD